MANRPSTSRQTNEPDDDQTEDDDAKETAPAGGAKAKPDANANSLTVDVHANLSIGGQVLVVNDKGVKVPDTAEVRECIAAGYLSLKD